jgi:hypothetical protein
VASFFIDGIANQQRRWLVVLMGLTATLAVFLGVKWKFVSDPREPMTRSAEWK